MICEIFLRNMLTAKGKLEIDVQWSSLISKLGFARENLLISELANRAILILEQLLIGQHYCTILQNNLIIASSC